MSVAMALGYTGALMLVMFLAMGVLGIYLDEESPKHDGWKEASKIAFRVAVGFAISAPVFWLVAVWVEALA